MLREPLPIPIWQGFDIGEEAQAAYARALDEGVETGRTNRINRLEARIADDQRTLGLYRQDLRNSSQLLTTSRGELALLEEAAKQSVTEEQLEKEFQAISELAGVLGTRVDNGYLIVHVRTHYEIEDGWYDAGDFEIRVYPYFDAEPSASWFTVSATRLPRFDDREGNGYYDHYSFLSNGTLEDGSARGSFNFDTDYPEINRLIERGEYADALVLVVQCMNTHPRHYAADIPQRMLEIPRPNEEAGEGVPPAPLWRGFMRGSQEAYQRVRLERHDGRSARRMARLRQEIRNLEENLARYQSHVRKLNQVIGQNRAELRTLRNIEPEPLDAQKAVRELAFIQRLPGVVGICVQDGYVRVHVRSCIGIDGKAFDNGDFEIIVRASRGGETPPEGGTFPLRKTRYAQATERDGYRFSVGYYWHPTGRGRYDRGEPGWFCFGGRATQINGMVRRGEFAEAIHLMICSFNQVNRGEEANVLNTFDQLPSEEVDPNEQAVALPNQVDELVLAGEGLQTVLDRQPRRRRRFGRRRNRF